MRGSVWAAVGGSLWSLGRITSSAGPCPWALSPQPLQDAGNQSFSGLGEDGQSLSPGNIRTPILHMQLEGEKEN